MNADQFLMGFLIPYSKFTQAMSPNTALCFCLVGISLSLLSRSPIQKWHLIVVSICASVVIGIGNVSLAGYISGIEAAYHWGQLTQMSVQAALMVMILGVGLLANAWARKIDAPKIMPGWIALPFAVMLLTITVVLWQALNVHDDLQISQYLPRIVLGSGLLLTALLTWGIWLAQRLQVSTIELRRTTQQSVSMQAALDVSSMLTITDVAGNIIYANDNICKTSQYSRAELLGQTHRIIKSGLHSSEFYAEIWQTIAHGKIWKGEFCNKAKDGTLYWAYATLFPFLGEDGKPISYMGIHHDITERKHLEADLQRSNRAFEEFDHVVAHELKAPMTIIKMAADNLVSAGLGPLNPAQEKMLEMINQKVDQMVVIIGNLLQMAQLNTPETNLSIRDMNVKHHLDKTIQTLHEIAKKRNVVIRNAVAENFPHTASSAGLFAEIMTNLLSNAIRYATHEIVVEAQDMPEKIQVCVRDDGPGIPKDQLARLFEKFSKDTQPQTGLFQGSGLGLYICKNMVQQLGGMIWAESEDGQGTRFYFTLPKMKPTVKPTV